MKYYGSRESSSQREGQSEYDSMATMAVSISSRVVKLVSGDPGGGCVYCGTECEKGTYSSESSRWWTHWVVTTIVNHLHREERVRVMRTTWVALNLTMNDASFLLITCLYVTYNYIFCVTSHYILLY